MRAEEIGSVRSFWASRATGKERIQGADDRQGWDEVLDLIMKHLTERDVIVLC